MRFPIYEDEMVEHERACCEQCHMPISEDDEEEFGVCYGCHDANQQAAREAEQEGADEKRYSEEAA